MLPNVVAALTPLDWLRLTIAALLLIGPGMVLTLFTHRAQRLDALQFVAVAATLAIAVLALAFGLLAMVNLTLNSWAILMACLAGWLAWGVWRIRGAGKAPDGREKGISATPLETAILVGVIVATGVVSLLALRTVVVQPGSDGYHHTLFAQAISDQHRLPTDLIPLTPLATFTYHFGYHSLVATLNWFTGIPVVALTAIVAQLLKALSALAVALLAEAISGRRVAGIVAAVIAGLVSVFPAFYVNWGRNTQLTGLVLMTALFALLWWWMHGRMRVASLLPVVLLAAGMSLAHYRVTVMAMIGAFYILLSAGLTEKWRAREWGRRLIWLTAGAALAVLLVAPWFTHVYLARFIGYSAAVSPPTPLFYDLQRLGDNVLNFPTNAVLLALTVAAVIWGLIRRNRGTIVMTLWWVTMLLAAGPILGGELLDTISVVISMYVWSAVVIGLSAVDLAAYRPAGRPVGRWVLAFSMVLLGGWGASLLANIVEFGAPYVRSGDLEAVAWVAENTPADAQFMVNTFQFSHMPDYVIGSDAGSWLPVLARRSVVTAPMNYNNERTARPNYPQRILALAQLGPDLTTPVAIARLCDEGVTHVFVGERGGPIDVAKLQASPAYRLLYQNASVYVFAFAPRPEQCAPPTPESP